jgi:glycosyltransferase involved in cell wall biosynthesis
MPSVPINPLVSIMIPAYNQPQYIMQAVQSALAQDYSNLEVVVSDDSTNDETEIILKNLKQDERLRYYHNETRLGRVGNYRKLLFEYAKGEWVIMLDGDDYFINNSYITNAISSVVSDHNIVLVGAGISVLNEKDGSSGFFGLEEKTCVFDGKDIFTKYKRLPNHQTDFYPRNLARELDFYRDPSTGSDSESLYRLCLHGKVSYINEAVAVWRVHQQNTTYTRDLNKQIKEVVFIDKVYNYAVPRIGKTASREWRNHTYTYITMHFLELGFSAGNKKAVLKLILSKVKYLGVKVSIRYLLRLLKS